MLQSLKSISNFILIVFIGLLAAFIVGLAQWTAPTTSPPGCPAGDPGCDPLISIGINTQTKQGGLNVMGNVGIGTATNLSQKLTVAGTGYATGDFRAPIFYDSDNTGYYVDPASGSFLAGAVQSTGDMRAPIFYDYNNTGYYVDPAATSRLNYGVYDNLYSYGWIQSANSIYSPIFYDLNNSGYYVDPASGSFLAGAVQSTGDMRAPIFYDYNNTAYYVDPASGSFLAGAVQSTGDMRAPVFYDYNNTGYYVDPGGVSRLDYGIYNNFTSYGFVSIAGSGVAHGNACSASEIGQLRGCSFDIGFGGGTGVCVCASQSCVNNATVWCEIGH